MEHSIQGDIRIVPTLLQTANVLGRYDQKRLSLIIGDNTNGRDYRSNGDDLGNVGSDVLLGLVDLAHDLTFQ